MNSLGKWKTALQMTSMIALLVLRVLELGNAGAGHEFGKSVNHVPAYT